MNTVMMMPAVAPRFYAQWLKAYRLHNIAPCPAEVSASVRKTPTNSRAGVPVPILHSLTVIIGRPVRTASERTPQAMMYLAEAQEKLICEAETALASQSVRTYRH
ncbi:hypothetical protein [Pantoea anthophila]|uniref:hypothetical protein n=1 Tax=Pantoea anthophila TaxID=470931 RepID=UPI00301D7309